MKHEKEFSGESEIEMGVEQEVGIETKFDRWQKSEESALKRFKGKALALIAPLMLVSALGCNEAGSEEGAKKEAKPKAVAEQRAEPRVEKHEEAKPQKAEQKHIEWKKQQGRYIWEKDGKEMKTLTPPEEYETPTWKEMQGRWVKRLHDETIETSFSRPADLNQK
jgi:hypothetical protein